MLMKFILFPLNEYVKHAFVLYCYIYKVNDPIK